MPQAQLDNLTKEFIRIFDSIGHSAGVDNLTMTMIGILFVEPAEISMEELARKSGYSLTSISQKVKMFAPFKMIQKKTKPGSRKVYLYMEKDIFEAWKTQIIQGLSLKIKTIKDCLPGFLKKHKALAKDKAAKEKIKIIENYYKQALQFEKILKKLLVDIEQHQKQIKSNGQ